MRSNLRAASEFWSGVVLAGGASTRMGFDKAFLEREGETLVQKQWKLLVDCGTREVMISGRAERNYGITGTRVLLDEVPGNGPLAGILSALEASTNPLVVVLAVDMPLVTCELVHFLLERSSVATGCVPLVRGVIEPLAAVYPVTVAADARECLSIGERGMRRWVQRLADQGRVRLQAIPAEHEDCFRNWNTPSDTAGEERLGGESSRH